MRRIIAIALLLALTCGAPVRGSAQMFDKTNPQREVELGRQASREVEREFPLSRNAAYQERVNRIGQALVDALPDKAYPYQFKVLAVPEFNAFCLPGGFMYVFEGLLTRLPSDDAVAFVMAHEITHASHRHWARMMDKMRPVTILTVLAGAATGQGELADLVNVLIAAHYSRGEEDDADRTGEELAWAAGFSPKGGPEAAAEMVKLEKGRSIPEYLSDHPAAKDRLKRLTAQAEDLDKRQRPPLRGTSLPTGLDLALLVGDPPPGAYAANPWFPLEVGREWTYAVTSPDGKSSYTVAVGSAVKAPSGTIYRATTRLSKDLAVPCQLVCTADALWRRNRPAARESAWQTDCLLAVSEGQPVTRDGATYTLLPPEKVETPAGVFADVLHLRKEAGGRAYEMWYARDVGLVKRVCTPTGVSEVLTAWKRPRG